MLNYAAETLRAALHALNEEEVNWLTIARPEVRKNFHETIRDAWYQGEAIKDEDPCRYRATHLRKMLSGPDAHYIACSFGRIGRLKHLHSINDKPPIDQYGALLVAACCSGSVEKVKFLHKTYNITADYLQDMFCCGFYVPEIAKYFHTDMGVTLEDVRANNCIALQGACIMPHNLETVKYLCTDVGITPDDIRNNVALPLCDPEVAEYFKTEFGIF